MTGYGWRSMKPLGLDLSKYQSSADGTQLMQFGKLAELTDDPVHFIIVRSGVSYAYKDPMFDYYWAEIAKLKLLRGYYHVVYFGESIKDQMEWMLKIANPGPNDLPVLDLEVASYFPKPVITEVTLGCMHYLKEKLGRFPMLYSRASWVDVNLDVANNPELVNADWWIAHYNLGVGTERKIAPALPKGVKKYKIHQTSDKMPGAKFGAKSTYIDTNRYNGTLEELRNFWGKIVLPPADPAPLPPAEPMEKLFNAIVTASPWMNTRKGPGIEYAKLAVIYENEIVPVYEVMTNDNGEVWWKIGVNRWASSAYLSDKTLPEVTLQDAYQILVYPFEKKYKVTQKFGENSKQSDPMYNWYKGTNGHNGIDFAVPSGTLLLSPMVGVVTVAAKLSYGYGHHLQIKAGDTTLILGHASELLVNQGDIVMVGQPIMKTGNTGASTGPHLHLETRSIKADRTLPGGKLGSYDPYNDFIKDGKHYQL